jgi:hypothetical protein
MMDHFTNRPCAAAPLISYRYRGAYGFVMIGATDDADAMFQAHRSTVAAGDWSKLEVWDKVADAYKPVMVADLTRKA